MPPHQRGVSLHPRRPIQASFKLRSCTARWGSACSLSFHHHNTASRHPPKTPPRVNSRIIERRFQRGSPVGFNCGFHHLNNGRIFRFIQLGCIVLF